MKLGANSFRNWEGTVRASPKVVARPTDVQTVADLVAQTTERGGKVRLVGSGHSFVPVCATADTLMSIAALSGVTSVHSGDTARARVYGGTTISALGDPLREHGLGLANQGDIHDQSIAGAVSTGTHGTGLTLGSLSTQVTGLELVTAHGETMWCSADSESEIFRFARLSLGSFGVITQLELAVEPAYKLAERKWNTGLDEILEQSVELARANRHFEFFYWPHTQRVSAKTLHPTSSEAPLAPTRPLKHAIVDVGIENGLWWTFCTATRVLPFLSPLVSKIGAVSMSEGERVDWSDRVFPNARFVRFMEMEYAVPVEHGADCLREIARLISSHNLRVNYPIEYRYVAADDIPLSPFFERDSAVLSLHVFRGKPYKRYFSAAEEIFAKYDGRPHWGKRHSLTADQLAGRYPLFDDFCRTRAQVDPKGTFKNDYLRDLFG